MNKIAYITIGPAGCGKSTWARDIAKRFGSTQIIERDIIRQPYYDSGKTMNDNIEKEVTDEQTRQILEACSSPLVERIIISDTNLNPKTRDRLKSIFKEQGIDIEYVIFDKVLYKDCLSQNDQREGWKRVPLHVMQRMYIQFREEFPLKHFVAPEDKDKLPPAYIFDIDGTVAKMHDRSPYDWHLVDEDSPHYDVLHMAQDLYSLGNEIIFVSGRDGICRAQTEKWLDRWFAKDDPFNRQYKLFMRPVASTMKDSIVKHDLFHENIAQNYFVKGVFDDRDQVVDMWRKMGLRTYQVAEGAF